MKTEFSDFFASSLLLHFIHSSCGKTELYIEHFIIRKYVNFPLYLQQIMHALCDFRFLMWFAKISQ